MPSSVPSRVVLALVALALSHVAGCAKFEAPPEATIAGLTEGKLSDPAQPIVIKFDEPPRPSTIRLAIAPHKVDLEGNLGDEDDDPATSLDPYFTYEGATGAATGGQATLAADGLTFTVQMDKSLPVGAPLVLVVEPKLASASGAVTIDRRRLVFSYVTGLTCNAPVSVLQSGAYFFLSTITKPVPVKVALFSRLLVDPDTGAVQSFFTKARRNRDLSRCPELHCASNQACRFIPEPACVAWSEPAASVDEFSDYVPDPDPATGFGFDVVGCAEDQDATTSVFTTAHVDVQVTVPALKLAKAQLTASFVPDPQGVLRGSGSLTAEDVSLGDFSSGEGIGDLNGRSLRDDEAPAGIPGP